ncbi:MAG: SPFH domain-containing protein [Patescibacteria group bacterium]
MGTILFVLFLFLAAFITYVLLRKKVVPVGYLGLVLFMGARTRRVFGEGFCAIPPGCTLELLEVKDHVVNLQAEDVGCGDGFKIVMKGAMVRYRLRQIIDVGSGGRFRTTFMSLLRRIVPYAMDSRTAEYLSMQDAVQALIPSKTLQAANTYCASQKHSEMLGYHVIGFVKEIIAKGGVPEHAPDDRVINTRQGLNTFVSSELTKEFESTGLEIISFTVSDFDPDETAKAHIVEAQEKIREIQVRRLQTSALVAQAMELAMAEVELKQKHPDAQLSAHYTNVRTLDINQIGAENLGPFGQILLAYLANLQTAAKPAPTPTEKAA